jgi:sulfonate transport system permease protein
VIGWEVAAYLVPPSQLAGAPLVPAWEYVFTDAFKGISNHWTIDVLAPRPRFGGDQTYLGALLALAYHSSLTLMRLLLGLSLGMLAGVGIGLIVAYWVTVRRIAWTPLNFIRMIPLLAAVPLFQFWLGANTIGTTAFVAIGVFVVLVVATLNAVANVPDMYVESARTLGASRLRTYLTVVVPAALPELRTTLILAVGLSWAAVVGAEYIGVRDGLGSILIVAELFTNTGQMVVIALVLIVFSLMSFWLVDRLFGRLLAWRAPGRQIGAPATETKGDRANGFSG